jgi:hypothetical protein
MRSFLFVLLVGTNAHAFTPAELRADFAALQASLQEAHGSLYRYTLKQDLDLQFDRLERSLTRDMDVFELYAIVSEALSEIKDGHTWAVLPSEIRKELPIFPLRLRFLDGHAWVVRSAAPAITPGAEILKIDGRPIDAIVTNLFAHLSGDGDITTGKVWKLNESFGADYAYFIARPESFDIVWRDAAGRVQQSRIAAVPFNSGMGRAESPSYSVAAARLPHTSILTLGTFAEEPAKFETFLEGAFDTIRAAGTQDLIIDMRGNHGGERYGPLVFSYIAERPFRSIERIETSTDRLLTILPYTHLDAGFVSKFAANLEPLVNGRFQVRKLNDVYRPQPHAYTGRVWILTNGGTFSTAQELCSLARSEGRATFIGEETGGAYHGYSSGDFVVITLPNTKLRVAIPLQETILAVRGGSMRRGVLPDHPVQPSIRDVLGGIDREMEETLAMIAAARKAESGPPGPPGGPLSIIEPSASSHSARKAP